VTPAEKLGQALADARRAGRPFDDVWQAGVGAALTELRGREVADWAEALRATHDEWEDAYARRAPSAGLRALAAAGAG